MRIDAFTHVRPSAYVAEAQRILGLSATPAAAARQGPIWEALASVDLRLRNMDRDEIDRQVITLTVPPLEQTSGQWGLSTGASVDAKQAAALAVAANNALRDMANQAPDRFIPVGTVSLVDVDAAIREGERCLDELGMAGIQIFTNVPGRFMHDPALRPFFNFIAERGRPLWVHPYFNPARPAPDYGLDFNIEQVFGWPFDTLVFMTCLIFGGVLDEFPNLTIITHHAGASIPFFEQRIQTHPGAAARLKRPLLDYYRSFYVDTAIQGSRGGMIASCMFYGPERILFGTDTPYASPDGGGNARQTLASIEALDISAGEKDQIISGNLQRLLGA